MVMELDVTGVERDAFAAAIVGDPAAVERHIREEGGTLSGFLEVWRAGQTEKALRVEITPATARTVLDAPLCDDNRWRPGERVTVREYLTELLVQLWLGEATPHDGMVGSSDWEYDLYDVLLRLRLVPAWQDGWGVGTRADGSDHPEDRVRARDLVVAAIRELGAPTR